MSFTVTVKQLTEIGYVKNDSDQDEDEKTFTSTYNDTILNFSTLLPSVLLSHLRYTCCNIILIADLSDFFKCIKYAPVTAISQQSLYYVNEKGIPNITSMDNHETEPVPFVYTFQNYGQCDSPISAQVSLILGIQAFLDNSPIRVLPTIRNEIERWLLAIYVDDYGILAMSDYILTLPSIMTTKNPINPMGENTKANENILNNSLCSICNNRHEYTEIPSFWCKPMYSNKIEAYVPLDCPEISNSRYINGSDTPYEIGSYHQHLPGRINILCMIRGNYKLGLQEYNNEKFPPSRNI